jgi:hypothetical protein
MSLLTIGADLPNLDGILRAVERAGRGDLQHTKDAVRSATVDLVQRTWIEYASGAYVTYSGGTFRVQSITGEYVRSIQDGLRFPEDLTGEVFSTSPHGDIIEDGIKPYDMKPGLLASPKAKVNKEGKRWITVPYRHGTPGTSGLQSMPKNVYSLAKNLGFSRRNNSLKAFFTGRKYEWSGRLKETNQGQRSHFGSHPGSGYTWKSGQFSGMVRMGGKGHTQYLTFRRVSENSDPRSWQHPGVKPRPIREAVVENTRDEVLQLIRRGFEMDLYFMGLGGGE